MQVHPFEKNIFDKAIESPDHWIMTAHNLRWSASEICWLDEEHEPKEENQAQRLFATPVYRMLLGLSFENLLKGILIAQGEQIFENKKLKPSFTKHSMRDLLSQADLSSIDISHNEKKILFELEEHVIWQGRYPIPKRLEQYKTGSHGNIEHKIELELWDKFNLYLLEIK